MTRLCYALAILLVCRNIVADTLDPVWVIATDNEDGGAVQVGEVEHTEFTGSYSHISAAELSHETNSLAQIVAKESGVQLRQMGGAGSYSSITVRAASAAQTNVYIDGVLLNNAGTGGVDLAQLELLNIGSVDIYRGATPVQLGVGNIGGAVNIRSPDTQSRHTRLLLGAGSFNSERLQLSHQQAGGSWDTSFAFTHQGSDNHFTFTNNNGTPLNSADDVEQQRYNSQFKRQSLLFKFGRRGQDSSRVDGLLQLSQRDLGVPHFRNLADNQASYDTQNLRLQLNQRNSSLASGGWNNLTGVYIGQQSEHYDDSLSQVGLGAQNTQSETDNWGVRSYWEHPGRAGTLAINAEFRSELQDQDDLISTADFQAERSAVNGALQYSLFALEDSLTLTPALRVQSWRDRYQGVTRAGSERQQDTSVTAQIGARLAYSAAWHWSINLGQYQREPIFRELFGDRGFYIGNDSLVGEKGVNFDTGLHWLADGSGKRRLDLTLFLSQRDELIVSTYDARGIGRSENTGKAQIAGLEGSLGWQWAENWTAELNFTAQSAENRSETTSYHGKQLAGESRYTAFASLKYKRGSWSAWLDMDYQSERFFDTANLLPANERLNFNLGVSRRYQSLNTTLYLLNLSDQQTEDFKGFPRPGRSVHLSLSFSFS